MALNTCDRMLSSASRIALPPRVYQDMVLAGQTVVAGRRDCPGRWEILAPHLPRSGAVLDVGSNLGWFGLKICDSFPRCVVASVEPDERSAALQRGVLASHASQRICLLTARANARLARRFVRAGQRFDAVLCLSVLHWLPDHRRLLTTLGKITRRFLVEHPDPREEGAGFDRVRQQIGAIGPYLQGLFPDRPVRRLAQLPSHRDCPFPREIWLVDEPAGAAWAPSPGLEVDALLGSAPGWPPRRWWQEQYRGCTCGPGRRRRFADKLLLTPEGLQCVSHAWHPWTALRWRFRLARLPEHQVFTLGQRMHRRLRRLAGKVARRLRILRPS